MKRHLQTICVVLVSFGIVVEYWYTADIGFLLITSGSLAFAISTKIEDRVKKRKEHKDHVD